METTLKILMLEDNADDAFLIRHLLFIEKLNCEISLAEDRNSFLQALKQFQPDIILCDHSLPQFSSIDAFAIARQLVPDTPFIVVTGTVTEEYAANMIKMGVDDYVLKDRIARLPSAITGAVQRRKNEKEKREAEKKAAESESHLRAIFENTSEGFLLLDNDATILAFNNKATQYVRVSKTKQFQAGQSIYDFIEEPRKVFFQNIFKKALGGEAIQYDRPYELHDGRKVWLELLLTPVIKTGQVKGIFITGRDISEKKVIEQEREFDRNNLKALINNTNDLMWSVDREFKLITSNQAFDSMVMAMSGQIVEKGSNILASGFSREQLNRFHRYYERAFSGESFTEIEHSEFPHTLWSEISFYPIRKEDRVVGTACHSRDITKQKKAEGDLKLLEREIMEQKLQEQKKIARAIIKAQEKERNHLGRELHDNINQILASAKMYLETAGGKNEHIKELIRYPADMINNSIEEIRSLCSKLVTPLKNIDLEVLVHKLLGKLVQNTGITTALNYAVSGDLKSDDLKLNLYRILQEQVNNIAKHAAAKKVSISIQKNNSVIEVVVEDDGKGFDPREKRNGIGISNIINRIESFNGEVDIESSPGKGCKITIKVPY